jgi:glutamate formiminotransferase/formiminotetrahydrofolate cyclodeaminase
MNEKLIECVPNFSEGRDKNVINQIVDCLKAIEGIRVLDVDAGADMNRTVVTFVGGPEAVKEAAFRAIKKASELIDMSKHVGSHSRMGATDVCPFVPVSGVTIEQCVEISKQVAKRVGQELGISVYLYDKSAQKPERQNLASIREGEYEGLEQKLKDPKWKPDFGPAVFQAKSGATVIGARKILIAYNINLNTQEPKYATDIAFELREKGCSVRKAGNSPIYLWGTEILKYNQGHYPCGSCEFAGDTINDTIEHCRRKHNYDLVELLRSHDIDPKKPEDESVKKPGIFKHCKAIGWMVKKYGQAQVSINLTDYEVTSMHDVLEEARKIAAERGIVVTGSEIVGVVPYSALLASGKYYLKKQGRSAGVPISDILETAVHSLGLRDVSDFVIEERVLGLPVNPADALVGMKVSDFVDEVSRESPAPGGGSIAALAGAMGASLCSMVCNLTANKRGNCNVDEILNETAEKCQQIKSALVGAVDADTKAFEGIMKTWRLPSNTVQEKQTKHQALQTALKQAVQVPLETATLSLKAVQIAETVAQYGNPSAITDVGTGAQIAFAGLKGGIYNILINLKDIEDECFSNEMRQQCTELQENAKTILDRIERLLEEKLA